MDNHQRGFRPRRTYAYHGEPPRNQNRFYNPENMNNYNYQRQFYNFNGYRNNRYMGARFMHGRPPRINCQYSQRGHYQNREYGGYNRVYEGDYYRRPNHNKPGDTFYQEISYEQDSDQESLSSVKTVRLNFENLEKKEKRAKAEAQRAETEAQQAETRKEWKSTKVDIKLPTKAEEKIYEEASTNKKVKPEVDKGKTSPKNPVKVVAKPQALQSLETVSPNTEKSNTKTVKDPTKIDKKSKDPENLVSSWKDITNKNSNKGQNKSPKQSCQSPTSDSASKNFDKKSDYIKLSHKHGKAKSTPIQYSESDSNSSEDSIPSKKPRGKPLHVLLNKSSEYYLKENEAKENLQKSRAASIRKRKSAGDITNIEKDSVKPSKVQRKTESSKSDIEDKKTRHKPCKGDKKSSENSHKLRFILPKVTKDDKLKSPKHTSKKRESNNERFDHKRFKCSESVDKNLNRPWDHDIRNVESLPVKISLGNINFQGNNQSKVDNLRLSIDSAIDIECANLETSPQYMDRDSPICTSPFRKLSIDNIESDDPQPTDIRSSQSYFDIMHKPNSSDPTGASEPVAHTSSPINKETESPKTLKPPERSQPSSELRSVRKSKPHKTTCNKTFMFSKVKTQQIDLKPADVTSKVSDVEMEPLEMATNEDLIINISDDEDIKIKEEVLSADESNDAVPNYDMVDDDGLSIHAGNPVITESGRIGLPTLEASLLLRDSFLLILNNCWHRGLLIKSISWLVIDRKSEVRKIERYFDGTIKTHLDTFENNLIKYSVLNYKHPEFMKCFITECMKIRTIHPLNGSLIKHFLVELTNQVIRKVPFPNPNDSFLCQIIFGQSAENCKKINGDPNLPEETVSVISEVQNALSENTKDGQINTIVVADSDLLVASAKTPISSVNTPKPNPQTTPDINQSIPSILAPLITRNAIPVRNAQSTQNQIIQKDTSNAASVKFSSVMIPTNKLPAIMENMRAEQTDKPENVMLNSDLLITRIMSEAVTVPMQISPTYYNAPQSTPTTHCIASQPTSTTYGSAPKPTPSVYQSAPQPTPSMYQSAPQPTPSMYQSAPQPTPSMYQSAPQSIPSMYQSVPQTTSSTYQNVSRRLPPAYQNYQRIPQMSPPAYQSAAESNSSVYQSATQQMPSPLLSKQLSYTPSPRSSTDAKNTGNLAHLPLGSRTGTKTSYDKQPASSIPNRNIANESQPDAPRPIYSKATLNSSNTAYNQTYTVPYSRFRHLQTKLQTISSNSVYSYNHQQEQAAPQLRTTANSFQSRNSQSTSVPHLQHPSTYTIPSGTYFEQVPHMYPVTTPFQHQYAEHNPVVHSFSYSPLFHYTENIEASLFYQGIPNQYSRSIRQTSNPSMPVGRSHSTLTTAVTQDPRLTLRQLLNSAPNPTHDVPVGPSTVPMAPMMNLSNHRRPGISGDMGLPVPERRGQVGIAQAVPRFLNNRNGANPQPNAGFNNRMGDWPPHTTYNRKR